jgi:hypothetical protein
MRRNLRVGGLVIFDVNTLATYEAVFCRQFRRGGDRAEYLWRGLSDSPAEANGEFAAELEVAAAGRVRRRSVHVQRHYSRSTIEETAEGADLVLLEVLGQSQGAVLEGNADEATHSKLVYVFSDLEGGVST